MREAYSSVGRTYVVNTRDISGKLRERKHRIICEASKWDHSDNDTNVINELQIWIDNNSKIPDHIRAANYFIQETILMLRIAVAEVEYCAL